MKKLRVNKPSDTKTKIETTIGRIIKTRIFNYLLKRTSIVLIIKPTTVEVRKEIQYFKIRFQIVEKIC